MIDYKKGLFESLYTVPLSKKVRVIIDTDAGCECDDQYAIIHTLMTAKAQVCGIIAEQYGVAAGNTMIESYKEVINLCQMGGFDTVMVYKGAEEAMANENDMKQASGIDFLIDEAMAEDQRPLFVLCQGALTNVASALLKCPDICSRIVLVVVGGINYPYGGYEFNTMNDYHAFNVVMNSDVPVWMVPEEVYSTMHVGLAELMKKVYPYGKIGRYLVTHTLNTVRRMMKVVPDGISVSPHERAVGFPNGESWNLGDSVAVGILISHCSGTYKEVPAPNVQSNGVYFIGKQAKKIRWYTSINQRLILEDFFSKIEYYFPRMEGE